MTIRIPVIPAIIVVIILGFGIYLMTRGESKNVAVSGANVRVLNGKQVIEIRAKGGYQPRKSAAKAGVPTILRFNTRGTFDCSSAVRIPSLKISRMLPPSGVTDIDLGVVKVGLLRGTCGMGMYPFEVNFGG